MTKLNLPQIQGSYEKDKPLASLTTIKVGGNAEVWASFQDWDDFKLFLKEKELNLPLTLIGEGSNMVICDEGLKGVCTHLGKGFDKVEIINDTQLYAEAGATCGKAARAARLAGLDGLSFYAGIPGSIGGAITMNAGCYGQETFDIISKIYILTENGEEKVLERSEIPFGYRFSQLPPKSIIKAAIFDLKIGDSAAINDRMRQINKERTQSQPIGTPSSGSWFRNPIVDGKKLSAWKVTENSGCRGLSVGGAQVSEKHANFFINTGNAKALDFLELSRIVEQKIMETQGIKMHREVRFIGFDEEELNR